MTKWLTNDGYIEKDVDFKGDTVFRYVGNAAHEIMHVLNKKERALPEHLKPYSDDIRVKVLDNVLSTKGGGQ